MDGRGTGVFRLNTPPACCTVGRELGGPPFTKGDGHLRRTFHPDAASAQPF